MRTLGVEEEFLLVTPAGEPRAGGADDTEVVRRAVGRTLGAVTAGELVPVAPDRA